MALGRQHRRLLPLQLRAPAQLLRGVAGITAAHTPGGWTGELFPDPPRFHLVEGPDCILRAVCLTHRPIARKSSFLNDLCPSRQRRCCLSRQPLALCSHVSLLRWVYPLSVFRFTGFVDSSIEHVGLDSLVGKMPSCNGAMTPGFRRSVCTVNKGLTVQP